MWYRAQMMAGGQWSYSEITYDSPEEWQGATHQGPLPRSTASSSQQQPPLEDWTVQPWAKQDKIRLDWFVCLACNKWITQDHLDKKQHKDKVREWMIAHAQELAEDEGQLALTVAELADWMKDS